MGREYDHLKRIYNERESRQGKRVDLQPVKTTFVSPVDNGTSLSIDKEVPKPPTHKAAETIGVGVATANKAARVVYVIDDLKSVWVDSIGGPAK